MNDRGPASLPERNPITHERHRREVLWQITIPITIGVTIALVLAIFAVGTTADQASRLADVSVIWLIAPTFIIGLIFTVVLVGMIYGIIQLVRVLPIYFRQAQDFLVTISLQVGMVGDKAVEPILRIQTFMASIRTLGRKVRRQ